MEFLDVVDEKDNIIAKASYDEIYEELLIHRIVHVLIFNDNRKLLLQLRSKHKSFFPLHWSTSVGGHVRTGETYEQAAIRECSEELGIIPKLEFFSKDFYIDNKYQKGLKKWLVTFRTTYIGRFTKVNRKEISKLKYVSLPDIQKMINKGEKFHPELLFILKKRFVLDG